jgi:hypothetical protein
MVARTLLILFVVPKCVPIEFSRGNIPPKFSMWSSICSQFHHIFIAYVFPKIVLFRMYRIKGKTPYNFHLESIGYHFGEPSKFQLSFILFLKKIAMDQSKCLIAWNGKVDLHLETPTLIYWNMNIYSQDVECLPYSGLIVSYKVFLVY